MSSGLYLRQTTQAAQVQLASIVILIGVCIVWLIHLYRTLWEQSCCGRSPKECDCCAYCRDRTCDGLCWNRKRNGEL